MQPKVILLWPTHASVWHHDYQRQPNSCHNVCGIILLLVQSREGSGNLGETCKCGVASAAAVADGTDAATAAVIATDADDTVDVAASNCGLSLLQFNRCIRAL